MRNGHEGVTGGALQRLRPWAWPFVANLYLLSPVLLHDLGLAQWHKPDKLALFAVPVSLLWLALLQLVVRSFERVHTWLLPLYFLVGVDLFLIFNYQTRLTSSMLTVILENWGNAADYARAYAGAILGSSVLCLSFWALCRRKLRGVELPLSPRGRLLVAAGLVAIYSLVSLRQARALGGSLSAGVLDVVSHDRNSPFGVIPQSYVAYKIYADVRSHQRAAQTFRFHARRAPALRGPELYVLVVGESSRPDHWGLYGYGRDTTPKLQRRTNLMAFGDVVSQAALTQLAVPLILTRGNIDDWNQYQGESSIVSAFKEVGFKTLWLSTQTRDQYTGAINRYSAEADRVRFFDRASDGMLVSELKAAISAPDRPEKLFVVLHTQGSHGVYEDRYPKEFEVFPVAGLGLSEHDKLINAYDNTIVYTDHVLSQLLDLLGGTSAVSALLYVSDHGENLKDDQRGLLGHFFNNRYDLPVPMLFWYSAAFERLHPERVASARANQVRKINSRSSFYTLAHMGSLDLRDARTERLSLLSPHFQPPERRVLHKWESVDKKESVDFDVAIRSARPESTVPLTQR